MNTSRIVLSLLAMTMMACSTTPLSPSRPASPAALHIVPLVGPAGEVTTPATPPAGPVLVTAPEAPTTPHDPLVIQAPLADGPCGLFPCGEPEWYTCPPPLIVVLRPQGITCELPPTKPPYTCPTGQHWHFGDGEPYCEVN